MAMFELTSTIISVDRSALGLRIDQTSAHDDLIQSDLACIGAIRRLELKDHIYVSCLKK